MKIFYYVSAVLLTLSIVVISMLFIRNRNNTKDALYNLWSLTN